MLRWPVLLATSLTIQGIWIGAASAEQPIGVGVPYWAGLQSVSGTSACITDSSTTSCQLFPAGSAEAHLARVASVEMSAAGACCLVAIRTLDVGGGIVTDSGGPYGTGGGSCAVLTREGRVDVQADRKLMLGYAGEDRVLRGVPGAPTGLCSVPRIRGNETLYVPCRQNSDCSGVGAGACNSSPSTTQKSQAGLYLVCESASGTITVATSKQQIKR